jgi:heme/copper-type cytochrome/quinol oxidase subunit 3
MTGLAWHAARHADRAVRLLLIAAALGVAAVYALAMEHGHVAQVSGMKAASHNAYACYYLLTGAEGVSTVAWTLCIAAVALLIWLRKTSAAAARNLGLFGVYLIALWAIHLFLFTAYNGGNG